MERTFKHRITNKTIIIGGQTGESMQKLISPKASDLTIQDIVINSSDWEEIIDKNPLKLKVGKEYILQYVHCKSKPQHIKITHFTKDGYPWQERVSDGGCKGIVSPGCYRLIEEVNQKDYEIISFISNNGIIKKWENGLFGIHFGKFTEKNQISKLEKPGFFNKKIHSVKRLSDGEVFTVKDHVRPKKCNPNNFIITGFTSDCNNEHMLALGGNGGISINKLKPVKKPLFKTFDGVDIYEGDKVSYVNYLDTIMSDITFTKKSEKHDLFKWFSTQQAAQDYINSNKVLFTTEDGVDIRENDRYYGVELGIYRFIKDIAHKNTTYTNTGNIYFSTKEAAENKVEALTKGQKRLESLIKELFPA